MSLFRQQRTQHKTVEELSFEFKSLYDALNRSFVHMDTRAPLANDDGFVWIFKNGSQLDVYVKDWQTGTWRIESFT